jgi:hypothetical protein
LRAAAQGATPELPHVGKIVQERIHSLFVWLVAGGWCWFVLRAKYCWLVADCWFVLKENYCWLVADEPNEQGVSTGKTKLDRQLGEQRTRENMQGADLSNLNREFLRVFFSVGVFFLFSPKEGIEKV